MKKVINGLVYNTETAEEVGLYSTPASRSDFRYCEEILYRTKKGKWFVHGKGGPMTRWAESCDGGRGRWGGSGILPITEEEALEWCETSHIDADIIAQYFTLEEA